MSPSQRRTFATTQLHDFASSAGASIIPLQAVSVLTGCGAGMSGGCEEMSEANRREFVAAAAVVLAGTCACCGEIAAAADAPAPIKPTPPAGPNKVDAGPVSQFSKDGVWDSLAKSNKVLIARSGDKI